MLLRRMGVATARPSTSALNRSLIPASHKDADPKKMNFTKRYTVKSRTVVESIR